MQEMYRMKRNRVQQVAMQVRLSRQQKVGRYRVSGGRNSRGNVRVGWWDGIV
jgi:hypothetical protein